METPLPTPLALDPGTVLAGKYRVVRTLGQGGMGIVVAARHLELHQMVALKMLLPSAAVNPVAVARFNREARASVKIKSPHVARVMDVGKLESGIPFIVMEYLEGESLAQRLRRTGPLPIQQAVEFVVQATRAVAEAHSLGIIHRDLKPANLFIVRHRDGTESIKVLDFGISKLTEATNRSILETLTQTAAPPGSPPYMAPEQLQDSTQVDYRVDIWSLGITLFELLAGIRPFRGKTLTEVCLSILGDPLPKLRKLRPEVPAELEALVEKCTAKDRDQRFVDIGAVSLALAPFDHDHTRHTAKRAARMAEQSSEHAVRPLPPIDTVVPTQRLPDCSVPPPPEDLSSAPPPNTASAMLASQVTHTAASEAVTRTSLAPPVTLRRTRRAWGWLAILGITITAALGTMVALERSARRPRPAPGGAGRTEVSDLGGEAQHLSALQNEAPRGVPPAHAWSGSAPQSGPREPQSGPRDGTFHAEAAPALPPSAIIGADAKPRTPPSAADSASSDPPPSTPVPGLQAQDAGPGNGWSVFGNRT